MGLSFEKLCLISALLCSLAVATPVRADTTPITDEAQRIYQKFGDAIYQVQVIDLASGKKTSIGSGFQMSAEGLLGTNYHVVAQAVQKPSENRLEYLHDDGRAGALSVVAVDAVSDLAILRMDAAGKTHVALGRSDMAKGTRLFALGNPHDIGFTIIEGTYNGLSRESFIDKIHFSGSLNPGMSGGPALGHDGRVAGINVSTAGNQISFLVPVEKLSALLESDAARNPEYDFMARGHYHIEKQLLQSQTRNMGSLLDSDWESVPFGSYMVPGRIAETFKCWGGPVHKSEDPFTHYRSSCSSQDRVFLGDKFTTGYYMYRYDALAAGDDLNRARFFNFYESVFANPADTFYNADEENVTNFACNTRFVTLAGKLWKSAFCIRRYKKYPSMHDMGLYLAQADTDRDGFILSVFAQGISRDNALKLSERFMREIKPLPAAAPPLEEGAAP